MSHEVKEVPGEMTMAPILVLQDGASADGFR